MAKKVISKTKTAKKAATKKAAKRSPAKKTAAKKAVQEPVAKKAPPKKKSSLSKSTIEKFRELLLSRRRDMIGDMDGLAAETLGVGRNSSGELSNMPTHPADIGTDNYEHEFSLGLLESESQMLTEIDQALDRINEGTYGICIGTGQPIGKARLKAKPWAKYCIEYARKVEQGLVRPDENDDEEDVGP